MSTQERCPFCDIKVSSNYFGKHLFRHHQDNLFINDYGGGNLPRLLKSLEQPYCLKMGTKNERSYFTCLHCLHTAKRQPFIQRHFPDCREGHRKKAEELYKHYSSNKEELETIKPAQPVVVEGYSEEQVLALIGAMMESIKSSQREEKEAKNKADYYEEKLRDTTSENIDDEESIPEFYPDDEDIDFLLPEDVTPLVNMAEKMKLRISNKAVEEAYQKWYKMPIKKKSSK